jgi:hypothetical protein
MNNENYIFLYNISRANFFLQNGVELIEIGRGKQGETYYKFLKTDKSAEVNKKWQEINKLW